MANSAPAEGFDLRGNIVNITGAAACNNDVGAGFCKTESDRAGKAGQSIGAFCQTLFDNEGQSAIHRIQGVMAMAKRYGAATTEDG